VFSIASQAVIREFFLSPALPCRVFGEEFFVGTPPEEASNIVPVSGGGRSGEVIALDSPFQFAGVLAHVCDVQLVEGFD
jgi:hypothetical protein